MESLSELCRACLAPTKHLESLSTEYEKGYTLKFMLNSFCTIDFDNKSTSSCDLICKDCSLETLRAYNFKLKCERSDIVLKERAQVLKQEDGCVLESKESHVKVDVSIVKNEQLADSDGHEDDGDGADILFDMNVKDEDYLLDVDGLMESDDNETLINVIKRKKSKKLAKKQKHKTRHKNHIKMVEMENKPAGKPGRKKKALPEGVAKLVDNSFQELGYRRIYECPKCSTFCKSFKLIHKHLIKLHNITLSSVGDFDVLWQALRKKNGTVVEPVEEKKDVLDNKTVPSGSPQYKCIDCEYQCKNFEAMKKHIIGHRGVKYMHCDECQYRTSDLRRLVRHVKIMHKDERRFTCEQCGYRTDSKYVMDIHFTSKHLNIRPFVCHLCAKGFNSNQGLMTHIGTWHERKKNHFCPTCGKGFFVKRHLKEHLFIHTGLKPHICEHCGTAFTQKPNLEKHVLTVHFSHDRIFQCPECPYKAKSVYSLKSHSRRHEDRTRFYCDLCGISFSTKDGVKRHIWRHMGEKTYKCMTCSYSCYDAGALRVHSRIHTGERPYPCNHCGYRSRTKDRLKNHMKSHLNEQRFTCQHCPYTANYRYNLVRHLRTNCGRTTRNYTPRKNKAAINMNILSMNCVDEDAVGHMTDPAVAMMGVEEPSAGSNILTH